MVTSPFCSVRGMIVARSYAAARRCGRERLHRRAGMRRSAAELTKRLVAARRPEELSELWNDAGAQFDRVHLVTLLHRCASLSLRPGTVPWLRASVGELTTVARTTTDDGDTMSSREICNSLWAFARLWPGKHDAPLVALLCDQLRNQLTVCNPQELANAMWALARLVCRDRELTHNIGVTSGKTLVHMSSQHLANISWAFGTLQQPCSDWFAPLARAMSLDETHEISTRHLVNILWGFARVGLRHHSLFQSIGNRVATSSDLSKWTPQDLAGLVWAYASLEVAHSAMFSCVAKQTQAQDVLASFGAQELQNMAWAFAIAERSRIHRDELQLGLDLAHLGRDHCAAHKLPAPLIQPSIIVCRNSTEYKLIIEGSTVDVVSNGTSIGEPFRQIDVTTSGAIVCDSDDHAPDGGETSTCNTLDVLELAEQRQQQLGARAIMIRSRLLAELFDRMEPLDPVELD